MYNVFHVVDDVENMAVQRDGGFVVVVVGYKRVSNIYKNSYCMYEKRTK